MIADTEKIPCSVEILTRNSALTLERCLDSVKEFAEIIVLDGNSTDGTQDLARSYGCRIMRQYETAEPNVRIMDYSEVRNKGLKAALYDWFLYIDSDEYLSLEAAEEIRSIAESPRPKAFIWWQPRKYVLSGQVIECATTYPNRQIRFFHRQYVAKFIKPIHERIETKPGVAIGMLRGVEYLPLETSADLEARWERYIILERKMVAGRPFQKRLRMAWRQLSLFLLYTLRYIRNIFFCRGKKMPFSYEWMRHKHLLKLALLMIRPIK